MKKTIAPHRLVNMYALSEANGSLPMRHRTVMVTGGGGFIGFNLTYELIKRNCTVIAIDNFDPYYPEGIKRKNIRNLIDKLGYKFVECDIRDGKNLTQILKSDGVEAVFHLSARPGIRSSIQDPTLYNDLNVNGTLSLLEACLHSDVEKIVYASSSSVYGIPEYLPIDEKHPTNPISPYGVSKLAAEKYCSCFQEMYGLECVILRYFTVYGPGQRPDEAIHKFAKLVTNRKPITIYGDGGQTRDFTYVSDVVAGTILAMQRGGSGIYNLGSGERISVNELIILLEQAIGRKITKIYIEKQMGDVDQTWADIQKAERELGYRPRVKIAEGIKMFYDWYTNSCLDSNDC